MPALTRTPAWRALLAHHKQMAKKSMREMFHEDAARFPRFSIQLDDILFDYSKNIINDETKYLLCNLARQQNLSAEIARMFAGEKINFTEQRPVLHVALRNCANRPIYVDGQDVMPEVNRVLAQMQRFSEAVRNGEWTGFSGLAMTDIVNIGIGGSDLGPLMAATALKPYGHPRLNVHFVSNIDAAQLQQVLAPLQAETTLFVVASKTFGTAETLSNARSAREWFLQQGTHEDVARHFVAISTNTDEVVRFGIAAENMFEFWDWVGGRYSLWSAIGLPVAIYIGMENFKALLAGAFQVDQHFLQAPLEENIPVIMGLLGIWYNNFFNAQTYAILPYEELLSRLPAYLQQLDMESNGKRINKNGRVITYSSAPVIWGAPGTNGQHAFYQLLHQGTKLVPADFLAGVNTPYPLGGHHTMLLANYFAQTEALMKGRTLREAAAELAKNGLTAKQRRALLPHRVFPGNKPSNSFLYNQLDPQTLGKLIALYEHKAFVQGVIWEINSFDQWGVELGKQLASEIMQELNDGAAAHDHDSSTTGLITHYRRRITPRASKN